MIRSFADKQTAAIFEGFKVKALPTELQATARRKLKAIDSVVRVDELKLPPGNRLEVLKGGRKGQYSIRINVQWRVCFRWDGKDAHEVEVVDYH